MRLRRRRPNLARLLNDIWTPTIARFYYEDGELVLSMNHWAIEVREPFDPPADLSHGELVGAIDRCVMTLVERARRRLASSP